MLALMDFLNVEKCVVYGVSGGGPIALNMARQDPKRVKALLLGCAVTGDYKHWVFDSSGRMKHESLMKWAMTSPTIQRMASRQLQNNPKSMVKDMLKEMSLCDEKELDIQAQRISQDEVLLERFRKIGKTLAFNSIDNFWDGFMTDMEYYKTPIPFEQIKVPTLILHGDMDKDVPFANAEKAHAGIVGSELIIAKKGSHLIWYHEEY